MNSYQETHLQIEVISGCVWLIGVLLDTYLNEEDAGCRGWMVIHIYCHKYGCHYDEDQDENSNDEARM